MDKFINQIKTIIQDRGTEFCINLLTFLVILLVGSFGIRAICTVVKSVLARNPRINPILQRFTLNVLGKVLWVILFMMALPRVGVDIGPMIAGLGVTGFIVGFACQETLGNLAAGLMLMLNQPFKNNDYIEAGGKEGVVSDLNIMATTLITLDNKKIVIPNKSIWGSSIVNHTALDKRRVDLVVTMAYGTSIPLAKGLISEALKNCKWVLKDPAPDVEVDKTTATNVFFVVRPWCNTANYWDAYFAANQAVKEALEKGGVLPAAPRIDISMMKDGQAISASLLN